MTNAEDLIKMVHQAVSRVEIKTAVTSCLAFTNSLSGCESLQNSQWFSVGEALILAISPSFIGAFSKREYNDLFIETFLRASPTDCITLLVHSLSAVNTEKSNRPYSLEKIIHLLDAVVRSNLPKLFTHFSSPVNLTAFFREGNEAIDRLIQDLVSIPDRAAAVARGHRVDEASALDSDQYSTLIALAMIEALKHCHNLLQSGNDCSLQFSSALLGKIYLSGYGMGVMRIVAPRLYGYCCGSAASDDYIWRRLSQKLFSGVHTLALDGIIADLVVILSSKGAGNVVNLEKVLGDSIDKDEKIRYVFINKLLLTRQFDESVLVPETISLYLSNSPERIKNVLMPTLRKLLAVWSSSTSTTRSSFEKHYYISRTIIICCRRLSDKEKNILQGEITPLILRGISNHLNAVDEKVRKLGMAMGELLTELFGGEGIEKLNFEYEDDNITLYLKNLTKNGGNEEFLPADSFQAMTIAEGGNSNAERVTVAAYNVSGVIDSDDDEDLIPYDLPEEEQDDGNSKEPPPVYIRDCIECIVERKSHNSYEKALRSLESLIRQNSPGADDLAVEVTRTLLHAEDHFGLGSAFLAYQISIMTACCVRQPKRAAGYLAGEFYEKNYSIQHRLVILDVLVNTAKELSSPVKKEPGNDLEEIRVPPKMEPPSPTPLTPTWREVVQARVEKKSRRWGSSLASPRVQKAPAANRFAPVAGGFFYPLLTGIDRRIETLDMFGADYIVLGRLLFALGTFVYEAENAPGAISMAAALMQFVLKRAMDHEQSYVRQGSLFALIMALVVLPSRALVIDFEDELLEVKFTLEEKRSGDPDEQCRFLAGNALSLLAKKSNEGLNAMIEVGLKK